MTCRCKYNNVDTGESVRWTWDVEKAIANFEKHKVSFELAERALDDPFAITFPNDFPEEERWTTLGSPSVTGTVVLYVVHTWPENEDPGRIISARRATGLERQHYEEG